MDNIKRIPYGVGDFEAMTERDYYVDKTMFIAKVEDTRFNFLLRPRRFGKTLFLSTLQSYYDIHKKGRFEEFYRDTWILQNPTPERARYMVLYFNFSVVRKDIGLLQKSFNDYCVDQINQFARKYEKLLPPTFRNELEQKVSGHEKLRFLSSGLAESQTKIYLMIDEYDNFTNTVISEHGNQAYRDITHGSGYFRDFFAVLKGVASGSGSALARMFITGVSPVTMDDVTSGFNIGDNISMAKTMNTAFGFTEKEVETMLDYYIDAGVFPVEKQTAMNIMRKYFDNYRFSSHAREHVFNTDMVLHYVKEVIREECEPESLIDDNVRIDYGKLRHLIAIDQRGHKQLNGNFLKLKQIIDANGVSIRLKTSFPHERLAERDNFISLLYFLGLLTRADERMGDSFLAIPNETIRVIMFGCIREALKDTDAFNIDFFELEQLTRRMAYKGEWKQVFTFIADELKQQTKVRDYIQGEKLVQGFILAYLNILDYYLSLSEQEMNKGYADIVLKPFTAKYHDLPYAYLLELKYIPRTDDPKKLEAAIAEKRSKAQRQLHNYANDTFAKKMMKTPPHGKVQLIKGIVIFHGWEIVAIEQYQPEPTKCGD